MLCLHVLQSLLDSLWNLNYSIQILKLNKYCNMSIYKEGNDVRKTAYTIWCHCILSESKQVTLWPVPKHPTSVLAIIEVKEMVNNNIR